MPASLLVKILVYSLSKTLCLRLVGDDSGVLELVLLVKAEVEGTDDRIGIVDGNGADIGKGLDLGSAFLDLVVSHLETKLANTSLDSVPASQARGEVDVAGKTEVGRVENLVGAGVVKDGLGVDTSLVGEGAETSDGVVEGGVDLNSLGNQVLELLELVELVLALDVLRAGDDHASHQATERGDTVTLADTENGGVDVGGTSLKSAVGVGNGAASIVVEVGLDIARNDATESTDEIIDLARRSATDGIGNTDTVDADLVNSAVERKEIDEVGAEGILRGEANLKSLGLDILDNLNSGLLNVGHILAVAVLTEEAGSADDDIEAVDTSLNSELGIAHIATDVSQDLGLEAELADGLAIPPRLLRGSGRGQLDVIDAKVVKGLGNLDLGLGVEVGVGELLTLTKSRLDNLEAGDIGKEVADGLVGVGAEVGGVHAVGGAIGAVGSIGSAHVVWFCRRGSGWDEEGD